MGLYYADYDHQEVMKFEMKEGRYFSRDFPSDSSAILLNEAAVKEFGFTDPIGEEIIFNDDNQKQTLKVVAPDKEAAKTAFAYPERAHVRGYSPVGAGDPEVIAVAAEMIAEAKRPLLYVGGGTISSNAAAEVTAFARRVGIPVTTTLHGLGAFPEDDPLAVVLGLGDVGHRRLDEIAGLPDEDRVHGIDQDEPDDVIDVSGTGTSQSASSWSTETRTAERSAKAELRRSFVRTIPSMVPLP